MSGFWIVILLAIVGALVVFVILQRRRPQDADKIASSLDASWKAAKDKAENVIKGRD